MSAEDGNIDIQSLGIPVNVTLTLLTVWYPEFVTFTVVVSMSPAIVSFELGSVNDNVPVVVVPLPPLDDPPPDPPLPAPPSPPPDCVHVTSTAQLLSTVVDPVSPEFSFPTGCVLSTAVTLNEYIPLTKPISWYEVCVVE